MKFMKITKDTKADKFFNEFYKMTRTIEFYEDSVLIQFEDNIRKKDFTDIFENLLIATQNGFIIDFYGAKDYLYVNNNVEHLNCLFIPCMIFKRLAKKPIAQYLKEEMWLYYESEEMLIKKILNKAIAKTTKVIHYPKNIAIK